MSLTHTKPRPHHAHPAPTTLRSLVAFGLIGLFIPAYGAAPDGKGPKGDSGDNPVVVTPVNYALRTVLVEGFGGSFDTNDFGQTLCDIFTDQAPVPINTDSASAIAVVDIYSGEVSYVDNLLTQSTIWTDWPEGVDQVIVQAMKINNLGNIIVGATPVIGGVQQLPRSYLLHRVVETDESNNEIIRYQPEDLGISNVLFINDLNWVMGDDLTGTFIRIAEGTKIYLEGIGLPYAPGTSFDLNNTGLYNGQTIQPSVDISSKNYLYDVLSESITYHEGLYCKDWPGRTLNDHSVIAGQASVAYEYKDRGKTRTGFRLAPGIIDPVAGLQIYDVPGHKDVVNAIVYINHQRKDGQSTILSYYPKDNLRDLWLKLPNEAGFHLYDAMDDVEKQEWSSLGFGERINYWEGPVDFVRILTPRNEDLSVDNTAAPTIVGVIWDGTTPGMWVCEPVPATP